MRHGQQRPVDTQRDPIPRVAWLRCGLVEVVDQLVELALGRVPRKDAQVARGHRVEQLETASSQPIRPVVGTVERPPPAGVRRSVDAVHPDERGLGDAQPAHLAGAARVKGGRGGAEGVHAAGVALGSNGGRGRAQRRGQQQQQGEGPLVEGLSGGHGRRRAVG